MGMGAVFAASTSPCVTVDIPLIFADTLIHYSVHLEPPASQEQVRAKNFGVILTSFWCPWEPWGHLGVPSVSGVDFCSILAPFWGAFGSPWGTLRGAFSVPLAAPGAREAKKTTHRRGSVREPDFSSDFLHFPGALDT